MWEHIHRSDVGDAVAWKFLGLLITSLPNEYFEVASESRRIARDIDDLSSIEGEDTRQSIWMHPISGRIDDDRICFFI